ERAGNRTVVLGGHEEDGVGTPHARPELDPRRGRFVLQVLVVERELRDLDDAERERVRRQLGERLRHLAIVGVSPKAADDDRDVTSRAHGQTLGDAYDERNQVGELRLTALRELLGRTSI